VTGTTGLAGSADHDTATKSTSPARGVAVNDTDAVLLRVVFAPAAVCTGAPIDCGVRAVPTALAPPMGGNALLALPP
jgi:hypothetical protein